MCTCVYVYTCNINVYVHMYTHMYITHIHTHVCVHTCVHTHNTYTFMCYIHHTHTPCCTSVLSFYPHNQQQTFCIDFPPLESASSPGLDSWIRFCAANPARVCDVKHVCVYVHIHTYMYTHTHMCVYMCVCMHETCVCTCACVCVSVCVRVCVLCVHTNYVFSSPAPGQRAR